MTASNSPSLRITVIVRMMMLAVCATASAQNPPGRYNPVADPDAQVIIKNARFTVLTPQLIRMEWSGTGNFEDLASFTFLNRRLPVPVYTHTVERHGGTTVLRLHTSALDLIYRVGKTEDGRFRPSNLQITLQLEGRPVFWRPGMVDTGNLLGTVHTLDGVDGDKLSEPMERGLVSRNGWTVVDDSTTPLFDSADFSFVSGEKSPLPWVMERPEITSEANYQRLKSEQSPENQVSSAPIQRQDWYFFGYGHEYKHAMGDYVRIAGPIPLPPYFALGAWYSRYWAYSDQDLEDLVQQARDASVPLDVLVLDMDWHTPYGNDRTVLDSSGNRLHWTGYTWNPLLFPDPDLFLRKIHNEGLHVTLNLHPASGVQPFEQAYPAMAKAMGVDPLTNQYIPFNITDASFARNYLDILHHPLEKQGVDFWWLDWQQGLHTSLPGVTPTWWLNYVHFTDAEREGKRPLIFHRWGGLGNHRYQIGFSGDVVTSWDSLAFQPWFTATAANVGYAYWSHDIGGHLYGPIEPELYTRWLQFGALSPVLRTHTSKNSLAERRIWAFPEPYSGIMRQAYQLRYALLPYIYTEARRTYDTGVAFLRPLYYDWPEQDSAYTTRNEYQLGDNLIVAPIATPVNRNTALSHASVWVPPGDWYEWPTGRMLHGPAAIDHAYSLAQTPIFAQAGSIVPMAPPMLNTGEKPVDPLILTVFPFNASGQSSYTLYQDSGSDDQYRNGVAARTRIDAQSNRTSLTLHVAPVQGSYSGMEASRCYEIRLPGDWPPSQVTINEKGIPYIADGDGDGWHFEGNTLTTVIHVSALPTAAPLTIVVHRDPALIASTALLDGLPGIMTRLREAFSALQNNTPVDSPPDELIDAMQTGDRLSYHPEKAAALIAHLHQLLPELPSAVARAERMPADERRPRIRTFMNGGYTEGTATAMLDAIRKRDAEALAAVDDALTYDQAPK